jgi:hypothetical protein
MAAEKQTLFGKQPTFSALALFEEDIGPDRISDMTLSRPTIPLLSNPRFIFSRLAIHFLY